MTRKYNKLVFLLAFIGCPVSADVPRAYIEYAEQSDIPPIILYSIALCESGKSIQGEYRPWPWTINVDGEGQYFEEADSAITSASDAINKGASVDIGLMQINWKYHGHRFSSIAHAIDPYINLATGAQIIREYTDQTGSLWNGIGRYHSGTPDKAHHYRERCLKILIDQLDDR